MPSDAFNLGEHPSHPGKCQGVILHAVEPISPDAAVWIIGSPVLKGYYTVWDGENLELGIGKLKVSETEGLSVTPPGSTPTPTTAGARSLMPCYGVLAVLAGLSWF